MTSRLNLWPRHVSRLLSLLLAAGAAWPLGAADWPQYRGPHRDGRSGETGLLREWPDNGPAVLWRASVGEGYSGIAVARGRVLTLFGIGSDEFAAAFDARTGAELWRVRTDRNRRDGQGNGPRATPTVDGGVAFVAGAFARLHALDTASGESRWTVDLRSELRAEIPQWGYSSSPLVEGDLLLVEVGGSGAAFAALDKTTGRTVWRAGGHRLAYSSPLAITVAGSRQVLFFAADGLVAVSPDDGRELWSFPWTTSYDVNAAMPVFVPRDGVFISSGYDSGAALIRISAATGELSPTQVWRSRVMKNHFNTSVLVGDHLYGFDMNVLKCIDARSGVEAWRARGFSKGSLLYADGHLIVLGGDGALGLVEATPEGYRRRAEARVLDSRSWTMPSLADGVLYLRDFRELVALRVGSGEPAAAAATTDTPR